MKKQITILIAVLLLSAAVIFVSAQEEDNSVTVYWSEIKKDNKLNNEAMMSDLSNKYGQYKDDAYLFTVYLLLVAIPFVLVYFIVGALRGAKKVMTPVVEEISELQHMRDIRKNEKELEKFYNLKEKAQIEMKKLEVDKMLRLVQKPEDISKELKNEFKKWPASRRDRVKLEIMAGRMISQLNGQFCMTDVMKTLDNVYGSGIKSEEKVEMITEIKEWTEGGDFCSKYRVIDGVQYYKMIYV